MRCIIQKHRTLAARSLPRFVLAVLVAGALLLGARSVEAGGTAQQQCQSAKDKAAGKYAACRQNAEAKLATSGDTTKYGPAIAKCTTKFGNSWLKANENAAKALVSCLDAPLTRAQFQTVIDYGAGRWGIRDVSVSNSSYCGLSAPLRLSLYEQRMPETLPRLVLMRQ